MGKENFNAKWIGQNVNDSTVIGISNKTSLEAQFGYVDSYMLKANDLEEDSLSLGLLNLFENSKIVNVPFISDALNNHNKIYVNGLGGSFTYDIAMEVESCVVVQDVSDEDFPGIGGGVFTIKLSHPYSPSDILSYDPVDGVPVIVVEDSEVIDEGNGYLHEVKIAMEGDGIWFPKEKLVAGTEFQKLDSLSGEHSNQFSAPDVVGLGENKVTLEYRLGDFRGVQVGWSAYSDIITLNGKKADMLSERISRTMKQAGGDYFVYAGMDRATGKPDMSTRRVQPLLEGLALAELMKMTATGIMFNRGNTVVGINGSKTVNEGLYHQLRRGHRFTYNNVHELRLYVQRAAEVIYHGTGIPVEQRKLSFKAGFNAHNLVREMFKQEFTANAPVHVDQETLPVNILEGGDRYNLSFKSYAIGSAFLNGIGYVTVEHDPSLDYDKIGDYISRGYSAGYGKRSWTLVMWDITDGMYSNVLDSSVAPKGVEIDQRSTGNPNLYLVKPKDMPDFSYGTRNGLGFEQGYNYSTNTLGKEYTCFSAMAGWIPDKGRVVIIEKNDTNNF